LPQAKVEKVDKKLREMHDKMIELIAKTTGLPPYFKPRGEIES